MAPILKKAFILATSLASLVWAQSSASPAAACSSTLSASYAAPSVANGYVAHLVANGLSKPRGIKFDSKGNLLVVESGTGITALTLKNSGNGCMSVSARKSLVADTSLNHGIEMSFNGDTLYASSSEMVYSWPYSAATMATTSKTPKTLINNMAGTDHTTRTLLLSRFAPGLLLVARGSSANLDPGASNMATGQSQIRAFNLTNMTSTYNFDTAGLMLGWGLRNDVGVDEEPTTGGIYSVENSADQIARNGKDIHQNNPAEEMNFLGYLNGTHSANQGRNFGYPQCFTAWDPSVIPNYAGTVGQQFAINTINSANNDAMCSAVHRQPPRLAFQAHMAPLDILFNPAGTAAWVTFHGSWDRTDPVGYKLSVVEFAKGAPVAPSTSTTAAMDVLSNHDNSACPGKCFRPAGLAWDSAGTLFMSSDATGEIYAIVRADGKATSGNIVNMTSTAVATASSSASSSPAASSTAMTGTASATGMSILALLTGLLAFLI